MSEQHPSLARMSILLPEAAAQEASDAPAERAVFDVLTAQLERAPLLAPFAPSWLMRRPTSHEQRRPARAQRSP